MNCQDCVEKKAEHINEAEYVLVDYAFLKLLCQGCLDEYCYALGEMELDFFNLETGLEQAFKEISGILEYHSKQYSRLLKEYSELKKTQTPMPVEGGES